MDFELKLSTLVKTVLLQEIPIVKEEKVLEISKTLAETLSDHFSITDAKNNVRTGHKAKQSYANVRKTGAEQYYTNPEVVDQCLAEVSKAVDLSNCHIIEPAGGTGEFIEGLLRLGIDPDKIESYDISPKHELVQKQDYFKTEIPYKKGNVSITNPPFGRASSLAKKFFNKDAKSCDYICYLVPRAWRKWSTQNSLDPYFHLVSDIEMPKNCFYLPDGTRKEKDVLNTVFQVWEKRGYKRKKIKVPDHGLIKKIVPKEENGLKKIEGANFSIVAFGHSCGSCREIVEKLPAYKTTTIYLNIQDHHTGIKAQEIKQALKSVDLSKYYNNVSYVQALSIQEINYELNNYFGLDNFKF